jgi:hypothetical protein
MGLCNMYGFLWGTQSKRGRAIELPRPEGDGMWGRRRNRMYKGGTRKFGNWLRLLNRQYVHEGPAVEKAAVH